MSPTPEPNLPWGLHLNNTRTSGGGKRAKRIVLIGPDCSGKTTLASRISAHYDIVYLSNRRISNPLYAAAHVISFVKSSIVESGNGFVLDQWQYPVDIIYSSALRGERSVMLDVQPIILPYLTDVLFLHLDASGAVLRERYEQRGDELWSIEQILVVAEEYRQQLPFLPIQYRTIDTSDRTGDEVFLEALNHIETFFKGE